MITREKKFFAPIIKTYNDDLTAKWRVEWYEPTYNGVSFKRIVKYGTINQGTTIEERLKIADKYIKSLGLDNPAQIKETILDDVISQNTINWRQKTIEAYNTVVQSFKCYLGSKDPSKATEAIIQSYLVSLQNLKKSKNTIAKYRNTLYTIYAKAVELGITNSNPVVKISPLKRNPQSLQFFSDSQINLFKTCEISKQLWLAIKLLFYCFIRPGELRLLKISAINFEYGFIEIPGVISKNGKTEKVSIPNKLKEEIQYLQDYPNNFYILSKNGNPGLIPVSTKWINDEHAKILEKLKIKGRYAFYSWKHTGAVKAVKAGINIKDLQLQLRHHSLDMVNEYLKNLGVLDSEDLRNRYPTL